MNNEYLFRVWDNQEKNYNSSLQLLVNTDDNTFKVAPATNAEKNRYTVEIFIGVLDKNGNKIFTNDVVKIKIKEVICDFPQEREITTVVKMTNGAFNIHGIKNSNIEIIGNAHTAK